jgi:type VI secretion system protein ImpF
MPIRLQPKWHNPQASRAFPVNFMPREDDFRITPSVLDRLLDEEPRVPEESPKSRAASLSDLRQSVRRDLEWLLNTRRIPADDRGLEEAQRSVAFYGVPDFTGVSANRPAEIKSLTGSIETAIKHFEPRFLDVKVTLEPPNALERHLRFRIEARLDVDPVPEPITFDSVMEAGSGSFSIVEK